MYHCLITYRYGSWMMQYLKNVYFSFEIDCFRAANLNHYFEKHVSLSIRPVPVRIIFVPHRLKFHTEDGGA